MGGYIMKINIRNLVQAVFGIVILTTYFILFTIVLSLSKEVVVGYNLYFILVIDLIIYIICDIKEINIIIMYLMFSFVTCLLSSIIGGLGLTVLSLIISLITISTIAKSRDIPITREYYFRVIKNIFILIGFISIGYIFVNSTTKSILNRAYVIELIFSIVLLRVSRIYEYDLKKKNFFKNTLIIIVFLICMTSDFLSNKLLKVMAFIFNKLEFILVAFLNILSLIFKGLYELVCCMVSRTHTNKFNTLNMVGKRKNIEYPDIQSSNLGEVIILALIIIIITFLLFKIIKSAVNAYKIKYNENVKEDEEIIRETLKKNNNIQRKLRKLFKKPKTQREKIILYFQDIEYKLYKKKIFKPFMNATQLFKVTSSKIESKVELKSIAEKYNEVKFSTHDLKGDDVEKFIKNYNIVKKQI
jgi:hypothetical protein